MTSVTSQGSKSPFALNVKYVLPAQLLPARCNCSQWYLLFSSGDVLFWFHETMFDMSLLVFVLLLLLVPASTCWENVLLLLLENHTSLHLHLDERQQDGRITRFRAVGSKPEESHSCLLTELRYEQRRGFKCELNLVTEAETELKLNVSFRDSPEKLHRHALNPKMFSIYFTACIMADFMYFSVHVCTCVLPWRFVHDISEARAEWGIAQT